MDVSNLGRGRIPTVDSLEEKIAKLENLIRRAEVAKLELPALEAKLALVSDPEFAEKRAKQKMEKLTSSLGGLSETDRKAFIAVLQSAV